jgi:hypothetical protein
MHSHSSRGLAGVVKEPLVPLGRESTKGIKLTPRVMQYCRRHHSPERTSMVRHNLEMYALIWKGWSSLRPASAWWLSLTPCWRESPNGQPPTVFGAWHDMVEGLIQVHAARGISAIRVTWLGITRRRPRAGRADLQG